MTASTIYMSLLGPEGLSRVARASHANSRSLVGKLVAAGAEQVFSGAYFHEAVIRTSVDNAKLLRSLTGQGIVGGYDLSKDYPELGNAILVCATETKTEADLDRYAEQLGRIVSKLSEPPPCARK